MASNIVKCASCNVVINELLAFIQNKADVMDDISLIQLCSENFKEEDIVIAKKLLFDSIPNTKRITRKNKGKSGRDINDIVGLLKSTHPDLIPIFVARDLEKLPPITFDHLDATKLLKDMLVLQREVAYLKKNCAKSTELTELKSEVENLMRASMVNNPFEYVNMKRGLRLMETDSFNSGPMALQQLSPTSSPAEGMQINIDQFNAASDNRQAPPLVTPALSPGEGSEHNLEPVQVETASSANGKSSPAPPVNGCVTPPQVQCKTASVADNERDITADAVLVNAASETSSSKRMRMRTLAQVAAAGGTALNDGNGTHKSEEQQYVGPWKLAKQKRRSSVNLLCRGSADTGPDSKFKAATIKVPLFISNVCKDTNQNDIADYIKTKTKETVTLFKINNKTERGYSSFKLYVCRHKLDTFLSNTFWPNGITVRRFTHDKYVLKSSTLQQKPTP